MNGRAAVLGAGLRFEEPPPFPEEDGADLRLAAAAAVAGGRAALPFYGSATLRSTEKAPGDPVTEADRASNTAILDLLATAAPSDRVLSEESPPPGPTGPVGRLWVVDPLDGTREFMDGIGEFSVMVGLAREGRAVLGAVFVPDPGVLYLGLAEGGAWRASCRLPAGASKPASCGPWERLKTATESLGSLRLVRSRSHPDALLQELEQRLGATEVIPSGSVGVKCARIATAAADLYVHPVPYLKEWDTCAPEALLRGAGGCVSDCAGDSLLYGKPDPSQPSGILAGTEAAWTAALPLVREVAAPILSGRR